MKFTAPKPQEAPEVTSTGNLVPILVGVGIALVVILGAIMIASEGCRNDTAALNQLQSRGEEGLRGSNEHLVRAIGLLEHIEEYEQSSATAQIMAQLGQWIADEPPLDEWTADPLVASLPEIYAPMSQQQQLAAMEFIFPDFHELREAMWMRNISNWQVAEKKLQREKLQSQIEKLESEQRTLTGAASKVAEDAELEAKLKRLSAEREAKLKQLRAELDPAWLAAVKKAQGDEIAEQLTTALQLFDWTIRNVQLDKTHWDSQLPDPETVTADKPQKVVPPPPGSELLAWQSLLMGRGDAANRGRIFLLLARQQGLDAVMLGLASKTVGGEPRPWAVGVVLGDEIYLFDPELGLPIPGPDDTGVATLAQLRKDPELLRQLDLDDEKYPVTADDLQHLVALIDATPQALSQRMLLVQEKLADDQKMTLTTKPSSLARRLRKLGLAESRVWIVPYRAFVYDQLRRLDREANAALSAELAAYDGPLPLFPARMYHLRGVFEAEKPNFDAKVLYLECRKPDREIQAIANSSELRKQLMERNPHMKEHPELLESLLKQSQIGAVEAKRQASYWLGLVAYEQEDDGNAEVYLDRHTLQGDPNGPWTHGAKYNLARIYERAGQDERAIALYVADDSPQRHGNRIRARRLKQSP